MYEKYCITHKKPKLKITEFAIFIGTLTFPFPENQFGPLCY